MITAEAEKAVAKKLHARLGRGTYLKAAIGYIIELEERLKVYESVPDLPVTSD